MNKLSACRARPAVTGPTISYLSCASTLPRPQGLRLAPDSETERQLRATYNYLHRVWNPALGFSKGFDDWTYTRTWTAFNFRHWNPAINIWVFKGIDDYTHVALELVWTAFNSMASPSTIPHPTSSKQAHSNVLVVQLPHAERRQFPQIPTMPNFDVCINGLCLVIYRNWLVQWKVLCENFYLAVERSRKKLTEDKNNQVSTPQKLQGDNDQPSFVG